jgi:hypothetical protein
MLTAPQPGVVPSSDAHDAWQRSLCHCAGPFRGYSVPTGTQHRGRLCARSYCQDREMDAIPTALTLVRMLSAGLFVFAHGRAGRWNVVIVSISFHLVLHIYCIRVPAHPVIYAGTHVLSSVVFATSTSAVCSRAPAAPSPPLSGPRPCQCLHAWPSGGRASSRSRLS